MKKTLIFITILFLPSVSFAAKSMWHKDGNSAYITSPGFGPEGEVITSLRIVCTPTSPNLKNAIGTFGMEYKINEPDKIKHFHFADFEGPNAPASKYKLGMVKLLSPRGTVTYKFKPNGYYADGFVFEIYNTIGEKNEFSSLIKKIARGVEQIDLIVKDARNPQAVIQTSFAGSEAGIAVSQVMKNCANLNL